MIVASPQPKTEPGTPGSENSVPEEIAFVIRPTIVLRKLLILAVLLVVVGTVANLIIYHVAPSPDHKLANLMQRLDLGFEPSLPAWLSSLGLLSCAVLLGAIALAHRRVCDRQYRWWALLAFLFLYLALDEAVMIHELSDGFLHNTLNTTGPLFFAWVIPGMLFAVFVFAVFARFLWQIEKRTRWLFITAGAIFVTGAIGMELIAGMVVEAHGVESLGHTFEQAVEEFLEMCGTIVFLYALLDYLGRAVPHIRLEILDEPVA